MNFELEEEQSEEKFEKKKRSFSESPLTVLRETKILLYSFFLFTRVIAP